MDFWKVPKIVMRSEFLSGNAKLLYSIIYSLSADSDPWASNKWLARELGCSVRQVNRYLEELKLNGFVSIRYEKNRTKRFITPLICQEVLIQEVESMTDKEISEHEEKIKRDYEAISTALDLL